MRLQGGEGAKSLWPQVHTRGLRFQFTGSWSLFRYLVLGRNLKKTCILNSKFVYEKQTNWRGRGVTKNAMQSCGLCSGDPRQWVLRKRYPSVPHLDESAGTGDGLSKGNRRMSGILTWTTGHSIGVRECDLTGRWRNPFIVILFSIIFEAGSLYVGMGALEFIM